MFSEFASSHKIVVSPKIVLYIISYHIISQASAVALINQSSSVPRITNTKKTRLIVTMLTRVDKVDSR